jgi:hypothetical protein
VIAGFVRGLSTRDVEATLAEALGPRAALSRWTVSRICAQLAEELTAWSTRRLDDIELDYLYLGWHQLAPRCACRAHTGRLRHHHHRQPGVPRPGARGRRGPRPMGGVLADLTGRGRRALVLVVSNGAPGLLSAVEQVFPRSLRQRCTIHRARQRPRQGARGRAGRGQGGVLADLRRHHPSLPGRPPSMRPSAARKRSPLGTSTSTQPRSPAWSARWTSSPCICGSRPSTGSASATRMKDSRLVWHCRPAGPGLASRAGVVDPGAKSRVVGLEPCRAAYPLRAPPSRPSGGGHAPSRLGRCWGLVAGRLGCQPAISWR